MPTIGHAIFPYLVFGRQRLAPILWAVLIVSSLLPDVDVVLGFLLAGSPWEFHRMLTHSLLFALLFLLAYLVFRRVEAVLAFIGVSSHILLDSLDTHGVPFLWPFSEKFFGLGLWSSSSISDLNLEGIMRPDTFIPDKILLALLLLYIIFEYATRKRKVAQ